MPRAAPRRPPLLLPLLLLPLLRPPARGAPAPPAARGPAWALVVPARRAGGAGELALHLSAFGRGFELRLAPDASFLAPGFRIERLGGAGAAAGGERALRRCFFSGTVNAAPASLAAVSLCGGLSGSFLLGGEEFTIRPRGAGRSLRRPHLLQRWGPGARRARAHPLPPAPAAPGAGPRRGAGGEAEARGAAREDGGQSGGARAPPPGAARTRRFVSEARFVETLLVADASMAAFYGPDLQVGRAPPESPDSPLLCPPEETLPLLHSPKTDAKKKKKVSFFSKKAQGLLAQPLTPGYLLPLPAGPLRFGRRSQGFPSQLLAPVPPTLNLPQLSTGQAGLKWGFLAPQAPASPNRDEN